MKRIFALTLAILFTIFTLPVNGWTAMADQKIYNNIKNGEYNIIAKAMHDTEDKASGAARFINEDAKLSVQDGKAKLTISVPHSDMASIDGIQIEGKEAEIEEKNNITNHTFTLPNIKEILNSRVQYSVPSMGIEHDVAFRFILGGLDELPVIEKESNDQQLIIKNPDKTEEVEYKSEIDLSRHFNNPAKLIEKNGKKYIQMTGNGGQAIDSLIFNDQKVLIGDIAKDGSYILQFEVTKSLSKKLDFNMIIDTGVPSLGNEGIMTHKTKMWFEKETDSEIKPESNPDLNVEKKEETKIEKIEFQTIKKKDSSLNNGDTKVKQKGKKGSKEIIYEVTYKDGEETGRIVKKEKTTQEPQNEIVLLGTKKAGKDKLTPDKAFSIDYTIMHEKGNEVSTADKFFEKPGTLIEKNGNLYAQLTINNGEMIKQLSTKYGNVDAIKKNKNGSIVVEFKVNKNLSNMDLTMMIEVPGLYAEEHDAILVFKKDTKKPIEENKNHRKTLNKDEELPNINEEKSNNDSVNANRNKNNEAIKNKSDSLIPDKAYRINYTIKQEDGIKDSVANDFFTNTGILLVKDGKTYLQMAIENGNMVRDLKGKYGEAIVVKKEKDGSTIVQLKVDNNLANMLLEMHVVVPEGAIPGFPGYDEDHKALLVFDKGSQQEIEVGDLKLAALAGNDNGPKVSPENNTGLRMGNGSNGNGGDGTPKSKLGTNNADKIAANLSNGGPDKPEFGSNGNGGLNDKAKSTNPQTGDLTNIWLYAFLLAGSLLILGVKFRRRTI